MQEEAADTLGPESAWYLAEVMAKLRDLSRSPVLEGKWAWLEPTVDHAETAIVDHLWLPYRGSRQTPLQREINPDNAFLIQELYRRNRWQAICLIAKGPSKCCPIDPAILQGHYTQLCAPVAVDTTLLRSCLRDGASVTEQNGYVPPSSYMKSQPSPGGVKVHLLGRTVQPTVTSPVN
ncbi:hypothetical protein HPB51_001329 [Rhipicephalus microplus]|uniref:Uncharacterized protein n=1 Tax=Rhipicephalus microplus TaxID=6941 RepID=A0A9J6DY65_RHIMP|nr:hypothetical protein HPB51_001329 [Rhipicephalus microplus]